MLVLTRKSEQKIIIGNNIVITVLKVQGDQVSIGIDAPKTTLIYREEIFKEIEQANAGGAIRQNSSIDIKSAAKNLKRNFKSKSPHSRKLSQLSTKKDKPLTSHSPLSKKRN